MTRKARVTVPAQARVRGAVDTTALLAHHVPALGAARDAVREATSTGALDAVTKELVRLRNARYTGCEF